MAVKKPLIAHLSDLHFGNEDKQAAEPLLASLLSDPLPDFIVVTGDLAERAAPQLFRRAQEFLMEALSRFEKRGKDARVLVIPGNHDVGWRKSRAKWDRAFIEWGDGFGGFGTAGQRVVPADVSKIKFPSRWGSRKPSRYEKTEWCEYFPEFETAFLKFDSNGLPGLWANYANGNVEPEYMDWMCRALEEYKSLPGFSECRKIALIHHHVHSLPSVEREKSVTLKDKESLMIMRNAGLFWKTMMRLGVQMVLHGHKHYATHAVIRHLVTEADGQAEEREILVLSAGSALSRDTPKEQSQSYYKIKCEAFRYTVQRIRFIERCFRPAEPEIQSRESLRLHLPKEDGVQPWSTPIDLPALESMVLPDSWDIESSHRYEAIRYDARISRDRTYKAQITMTGSCENEFGSDFIRLPFVVIGAPGRKADIACTAIDLSGNSSLETELEFHPSNVDKICFKIKLNQPLKQTDRFNVQIIIAVPKLMFPSNDYDAVGLTRFDHGLGEFSYTLTTEAKLTGLRFFSLRRSGLRQIAGDCQQLNGEWRYWPKLTQGVAELRHGLVAWYSKLV